MRTKTQSNGRLLYKQWLCKCDKVYKDYIECDTELAESTERQKYEKKEKKLVFQKNR